LSLASIGILAFAAVAQFAPGILAALYSPGASRAGVFWGMFAGFMAWRYLLFLPSVVGAGVLRAEGALMTPSSGGDAGISVAYAGRQLSGPVQVVVP
jgi:Na+/proline symporter